MRMNLRQALEMINRGETPEQFEARMKRISRLANERDALMDGIQVLEEYGDSDKDRARLEKKRKRLGKVLAELDRMN